MIAAFVLLLTLVQPSVTHAPCTRIPEERVRHIIACAANRFGVDVDKALDVAECESTFHPEAIGGTGNNYYGLFQHHRELWEGRWAKWGVHPRWEIPNDPLNPYSNALVSMQMVREVGWGPWACA